VSIQTTRNILIDTKSTAVFWAYSVHKYNARNGQQSTAEAVAKHLGDKIKSGK
jgi:hypothetical protein